jgi:hypothetical protein
MVTFRKSFLLLAIVSLVAVAAYAADAPFACQAQSGVTPTVRAEGLAELVGDIVIVCEGGVPTAYNDDVPQVNFRVYLNTNVTSRLLDGAWNEALLLIDEPTPAQQVVCTSASGCEAVGSNEEPGVDYSSPVGVGGSPGPGETEANVFQGQFVTGNTVGDGNTIDWVGVPIDPPGTVEKRVIRITNIRANAAARGVGGGMIPSQLIAYISTTPSSYAPINNPQQVVGFVQDGLTFSAGSISGLQCEEPPTSAVTLTFEERFGEAFQVRNIATTPGSPGAISDQADPGSDYQTETGLYNSALASTHGANVAGLASQGTRLVAKFTNIPSGVTVKVSDQELSGADMVQIVSGADSNGAGGSPGSYDGTVSYVSLSMSGGAATATWEVVASDPQTTAEVNLGVKFDWTPNTSSGYPALGTGAVAGSYGPLSDVVQATTANLQPRFVDDSEAEDILTINSCATNLLWPYVTNQAGFDSGLVIANTSRDPFGTTTQEGFCKIHYYGNSDGSDAPAMEETPVIDAGGYAIWTLSSGGGVKPYGKPLEGSIAATPGFEGYVIAHCLFQYAHGYGFISDLGAQKLAQGYLALIMDGPIDDLPRTGTKSEPLNQ